MPMHDCGVDEHIGILKKKKFYGKYKQGTHTRNRGNPLMPQDPQLNRVQALTLA
jgi:hypothetical protein